jgi:hypothetical protein
MNTRTPIQETALRVLSPRPLAATPAVNANVPDAVLASSDGRQLRGKLVGVFTGP